MGTPHLGGEKSVKFLLEEAGPHEQKLREFCEPFALPAGIEPYDKPVCIMLFSNRSGSSLIAEHMRASPFFGGFGEHLNWKHVTKLMQRSGNRSFPDYLREMQEVHAPGQKLFGMKASVDQALMLMRARIIPECYKDVRWVLIERNDVVAQAISMYFAGQSKQWRSDQAVGSNPEPEYDFEKIRLQMQTLSQRNVATKSFCAVFGIKPYRIEYEEFASEPLAGAQALAAYLGVPDADIDESKVSTRVQRGSRNTEFRERFLAEYRASILG